MAHQDRGMDIMNRVKQDFVDAWTKVMRLDRFDLS
jgi:catalase (peroxidase I)